MSFLNRIRAANTHDIKGFRPFTVAGVRVGFVNHGFAETLGRWPAVFRVEDTSVRLADELNHPNTPASTRTETVHDVLLQLRAEGLVNGWRDEPYPVNRFFAEPPYLSIERAAIPWFGVCGYGVHLNGFVQKDDDIMMWIARRSLSKPTGPGKLDQVVAGGQPVGIGLKENLAKECQEEASIPDEIVQRVVPVGAISYCLEIPQGLRPDVIFNYDLELPPDFTPVNTDGEVEEFYLWPLEKVIETVRDSDAFKFNCALVVIDFLVRRGFIPPEHPNYLEILSGLRAREPVLASIDGQIR